MQKRRKSAARRPASRNAGGIVKKQVSSWRLFELTTDEAGAAIKMGGERVRQLTKAGWIKKAARGRYKLGNVIDGILAYRDDAERRASPSSERTRLEAARARGIELRNAKVANELIQITDVHDAVTDICGMFSSELRSLPAAATRDLKVREDIEAALNGAFERLHARFEKMEEDLRNGRDPLGDEADD